LADQADGVRDVDRRGGLGYRPNPLGRFPAAARRSFAIMVFARMTHRRGPFSWKMS